MKALSTKKPLELEDTETQKYCSPSDKWIVLRISSEIDTESLQSYFSLSTSYLYLDHSIIEKVGSFLNNW